MEVCARVQAHWPGSLMERRVAICKIVLVLTHLHGRVQNLFLPSADPADDDFVDVGRLAVVPLLQLNDYGALTSGLIMPADQAVESLR